MRFLYTAHATAPAPCCGKEMRGCAFKYRQQTLWRRYILEANALIHPSKARIGSALLQSAQKFNRMAGSRMLTSSRVLAGSGKLLNATEGAANFSSKFGTKLGVSRSILCQDWSK